MENNIFERKEVTSTIGLIEKFLQRAKVLQEQQKKYEEIEHYYQNGEEILAKLKSTMEVDQKAAEKLRAQIGESFKTMLFPKVKEVVTPQDAKPTESQ